MGSSRSDPSPAAPMVDPPRTDPAPYVRLARRHLPAIPFRTARPVNRGWGCFVLEVDHEWILRFPRTPKDALRVEQEARLLAALDGRVPVPIPHYEQVVRSPRGRILFVVYPMLKGRPLPGRQLSGARGRTWATDLIGLLEALQRFPRGLGRRLGVEWWRTADAGARWRHLYPLIRRKVHPLLPAELVRRDRDYWETYMAEAKRSPPRTVLTHGDLGAEHILVDDRGISGVIDWESACFEDPVGDVTLLPTADGFADRVAEARFGERDPDWRRRVAFHRHAVPVYSILYALEHRDRPALRTHLVRYRRTLPPRREPALRGAG